MVSYVSREQYTASLEKVPPPIMSSTNLAIRRTKVFCSSTSSTSSSAVAV